MLRAPLRSSAPRSREVAFARSLSALADLVDETLGRVGPQVAMATAGADPGWLQPERPVWRPSIEAPPARPSSVAADAAVPPTGDDGPHADAMANPDRIDAGHLDAGHLDAGHLDAGHLDAGHLDAGHIDAEHIETWQLVSRAQGGDGEAFGVLYDRYVDVVFRFIYYRVNDRALAEDFTSETFLRALRRIGSISYQGRDIGAWFVTIARNIVLDHMKSARNRLETTTADTIESREHERSTETAVLETLQSERLMQAVDQLGDEQRECIMLRFIQGLSVSETAAVMSKNEGAIKALQHRAVRKLADLVGQELR